MCGLLGRKPKCGVCNASGGCGRTTLSGQLIEVLASRPVQRLENQITPGSVDFITIACGFRFSVHTGIRSLIALSWLG